MKIKICFVVETTFKMTPYLRDVQESIGSIIHQIRFYNREANILLTMVNYRDYKDCEQLQVTSWLTEREFYDEWENLEQNSRVAWFSENDTADVAGGVNCAANLDWSDADSRLVFHYGISPAHGVAFHSPDLSDRYPKGDPNGVDLLKDVHALSCVPCDYTFFRINSMVDTMLSLMDESYTGGGVFRTEDLDLTDSYTSEPDSEEE